MGVPYGRRATVGCDGGAALASGNTAIFRVGWTDVDADAGESALAAQVRYGRIVASETEQPILSVDLV